MPDPGSVTVDLIYVQHADGTRTMTGVVSDAGGDLHMVGPFPAKGAVGSIAESMVAINPARWTDVRACQSDLTLVHFRHMGVGVNFAGQEYPYCPDGGF